MVGILGAKIYGNDNCSFSDILTDSRDVSNSSRALFIAIKGERHDGHRFLNDVYRNGGRMFLVNELPSQHEGFTGACFICVDNTLVALQKLAAWKRHQFKDRVIGITGSNGKTIVKEWLAEVLQPDFTICKSPGSFNSQVGVPLSVWRLESFHQLGIFEAGVSLPGEMEKLEKVIAPQIGVFTAIGPAHNENFESEQQKIKEKFLLFRHAETIVCNYDNQLIREAALAIGKNVFFWGKQTAANLRYETVTDAIGTKFKINYQGENLEFHVSFTDSASIENILSVISVCIVLGINPRFVINRIQKLQALGMRLQIKQGINNTSLINDAYSNDLHSLEIALDFLNRQPTHPRKIVVLSDIFQSGLSGKELFGRIADLMKSKNIAWLIGVGVAFVQHQHLFKDDSSFFETTDDLLSALQQNPQLIADADVLIKGARPFRFERISQFLQQKSHDTTLEINLNNLVHNVNYYKAQLKPGTGIMAMVKAFGYGSGGVEIASALQHNRINYLAVAYADEGVELRKNGITVPIMVMNPEEQSFDDLIRYNLEPEVFSFRILAMLLRTLKAHHKNYNSALSPLPIHIKLDTGMHRLGFSPSEIDELLQQLKQNNRFEVRSVFSHLVASENPEFDNYTNQQIKLFDEISLRIKNEFPMAFRHLCNSGAITRFEQAHFDMVRLGIGMYGISSNPDEQRQLLNVSTLKTSISQIRNLKAGDTVGYSRKGVLSKDSRIATVPIGYADGIDRHLGNGKGNMYINKIPVPIIGNVCMDMCMLDVGDINCKEGDEVIVFSSAKQITDLASCLETIPYEVLTSVSARVKRVYVHE